MARLETLVREFISLTAGRCDVSAHNKLAMAIANHNATAAWPRVRNVVASIDSAEDAGYTAVEKARLGELLAEIESAWAKRI